MNELHFRNKNMKKVKKGSNIFLIFVTFLVDQLFRTEEKLGRDHVKYDSYESIYERLRTGNVYLKYYIIY